MDAVLYAAKSTEDRRGSIGRQLRACREVAEREGWTIAGEHEDENKSGYHGSRGRGLQDAMAQAEELAPCVLLVHHSDRLARGDAKQAKHLVEYALWAIKTDVSIRSVNDDRTFLDLPSAANQGQRNTEDSAIKSTRTKEGLLEAVENGAWRGGTTPDGYKIVREVDEDGHEQRRLMVKDPERSPIYELIWSLALEGKSELAISLELGRRGHRTVPRSRNRPKVRDDARPSQAGPRPFSVDRVAQVLQNPLYAGQQTLHGKTYPGEWPTYVGIGDFERLRAARAKHSSATKRAPNRPPVGYLLAGLARCGKCGATAQAITGKPRRDGTRRRQYLCEAHRKFHRDSDEWCSAGSWDATEVDRHVLDNIESLLGDAEAIREQLQVGQQAERDKLGRIAQEADAEARAAERAADRADAAYADALEGDDDETAAIALAAAKLKRQATKKARLRLDAALDALAHEPEPDAEEAMMRLWHELGTELGRAGGDLQAMNAALREDFDAFFLKPGEAITAPVVNGQELLRIVLNGREPTPELLEALEALKIPPFETV